MGAHKLDFSLAPPAAELLAMLKDIEKDQRDFRKAFRKIRRQVLLPAIRRSFSGRASPAGGAWPKADAFWAYLKRRYHGRAGTRVNILSGAYKRELTRSKGGVRVTGKTYMIHGTNLPYAGSIHWGKKSVTGRAAEGGGSFAFEDVGMRRSKSRRRKARIAGATDGVFGIPPRHSAVWSRDMADDALAIMVESMKEQLRRRAARAARRRR